MQEEHDAQEHEYDAQDQEERAVQKRRKVPGKHKTALATSIEQHEVEGANIGVMNLWHFAGALVGTMKRAYEVVPFHLRSDKPSFLLAHTLMLAYEVRDSDSLQSEMDTTRDAIDKRLQKLEEMGFVMMERTSVSRQVRKPSGAVVSRPYKTYVIKLTRQGMRVREHMLRISQIVVGVMSTVAFSPTDESPRDVEVFWRMLGVGTRRLWDRHLNSVENGNLGINFDMDVDGEMTWEVTKAFKESGLKGFVEAELPESPPIGIEACDVDEEPSEGKVGVYPRRGQPAMGLFPR